MGRVVVKETDLSFGNLVSREVTEYLVMHHVGDINRDVSAEEIHSWHKAQGWSGIGYHYVIRKDGIIERGRPRSTIGSHTYGYNSSSIGINVVGDFDNNEPEEVQLTALKNLLADLCDIYGLNPHEAIMGHMDFMSTACPGANLYKHLLTIRDDVAKMIA